MKKALLAISIITCFCFSQCEKDINGLPPATQEGRNTLGFLLNGEPWTPKGQVGLSANLAISVDFGYKNGVFSLTAYKTNNAAITEYFGLGLRDSLNYLSFPVSLQLTNNSLYGIRLANGQCAYYSTDIGSFSNGNMTITKLDKISRIISGTFNATLFKSGCDTIKITEGRFDMKY